MRRGVATLLAGIMLMLIAPHAIAAEAAHARVEARLHRDGFAPQGEPRRKGDLLLLQAIRGNVSWLLVVDRRTGEIIGQRRAGTAPLRD